MRRRDTFKPAEERQIRIGAHKGILNLTPTDDKQAGELVGIAELRGRVDESAKLGELLLQMQTDFERASAA